MIKADDRLAVRSLVSLFLLVGLIACTGMPAAPESQTVALYADGTTALAGGIEAAVAATDRLDTRAAELKGARAYLSGSSPDLQPQQAVMSPRAREATETLLAGLVAYAQRLSDLADGSEGRDGADITTAAAGRLVDAVIPNRLPDEVRQRSIEAMGSLAYLLTEAWVGRTVADVAADLQPTIAAIVLALDLQLSEMAAAAEDAAHELRFNREQILIELRASMPSGGIDLLEAYDEALREQALTEVTTALADARAGLKQLVAAHAALAAPMELDASAEAARLVALARRLASLAKSVG